MKGSIIWYTQRYSAIFLLCYVIYLANFIYFQNDITFFSWSNFFLSFQMRLFTSLTFVVLVIHAFIGLWTVGTDYLTERTLGFLSFAISKYANLLRRIYLSVFTFLGIVYLTVILYIIWL